MKFAYTIIYVEDVENTIAFYQKAFNLQQKFFHESKQYAELNTGDITLAFASNTLAESNGVKFVKNNLENPAAGFEIALVSDDVNLSYNHAMASGAVSVKEPALKPWGQEVAYVRDINGIVIEICSPIS